MVNYDFQTENNIGSVLQDMFYNFFLRLKFIQLQAHDAKVHMVCNSLYFLPCKAV